ncbi:MAG: glycosyltransferase family 39 protein [Actinobacteria bacterium]|nr:glycosyltransferase family 39 protein [Actinomycetota bacterium]
MTDQVEMTKTLQAVSEENKQGSREPPVSRSPQIPALLSRPITVQVVGVASLMAVVGFLWGRAAAMSFWLDEGISVGVASHPLRDIPSVLLQDGSPPLYYLVLHLWMSLFGESNTALHTLSLLFALATVPAALWAGWSLFDRRTGWICALVVAINPFVAYYATETRMYSMGTLLAVLTIATFLHAFVLGRRRYVVWFAVSQALLLYTHNWGLLLAVGSAAALVPLFLLGHDRRRLVIDAALGFGGVALLYAPWVPSIAYQVGQHLQPWGRRADLVLVRDEVARALGGEEAFVALGLGAGIGLAALLQGRRWDRHVMAVLVLGIIPVVALAVGWRVSVFAFRYLAVIVGPLVVLAGVGLARSGRAGLAALGVAAFLTAPISVKGPPYQKSNAEAVAAAVSPQLQPGDLVVLPDFQMVPLAAHYLPPGLRYATASGLVPDKDIVDWRNSMDRLVNDDPANTLPPLLDTLAPGAHLLVMCPPPGTAADATGLIAGPEAEEPGRGTATVAGEEVRAKTTPLPEIVPFHSLILLRCEQTDHLLDEREDLEVQEALKAPDSIKYTPVDGRLFVKKRPAASD